jgi:hypothetical protein
MATTENFKNSHTGKATEPKSLSPFFLFSSRHRDSIKEDHPEWKVTEVAAELARRWATLPDSEKALYISAEESPKPEIEKGKPVEKKPLSGFFLFSSQHRDAIKREHPEWKVTEIAAELGKRWAALSDSEKASFKA